MARQDRQYFSSSFLNQLDKGDKLVRSKDQSGDLTLWTSSFLKPTELNIDEYHTI